MVHGRLRRRGQTRAAGAALQGAGRTGDNDGRGSVVPHRGSRALQRVASSASTRRPRRRGVRGARPRGRRVRPPPGRRAMMPRRRPGSRTLALARFELRRARRTRCAPATATASCSGSPRTATRRRLARGQGRPAATCTTRSRRCRGGRSPSRSRRVDPARRRLPGAGHRAARRRAGPPDRIAVVRYLRLPASPTAPSCSPTRRRRISGAAT